MDRRIMVKFGYWFIFGPILYFCIVRICWLMVLSGYRLNFYLTKLWNHLADLTLLVWVSCVMQLMHFVLYSLVNFTIPP